MSARTTNQFLRRWGATIVVVVATLALWTAAKINTPQPPDLWPWLAPSQMTAQLSVAFMALALVAGGRSKTLEWMFGGLDKAVKLHRILGPAALILAVVHLALLVPPWIGRGLPAGELFIPFVDDNHRTPDILLTYGFFVLAAAAYASRLRYENWQWTHRVNGVLFIVFMFRLLEEPGTVADYEPLRFWIVFLTLAGAGAFLYRVLLFRRLGPRSRYTVEKVVQRSGDAFDLVLRPKSRRLLYDPGCFAFISLPDDPTIPAELHPFSFSSSPVGRNMRFSIRAVGDYTRALRDVAPGAAVDVYGPFGGFTPHAFVDYRRLVLVGAGIGVTPFLSMLSFETTNDDFRRIWLYYVVRDAEDAPYDRELAEGHLQADSYVSYTLWATRERGRITAAAIVDDLEGLDDYAVMLCGTDAFNRDMTRQFRALGLPAERIISEEFSFR